MTIEASGYVKETVEIGSEANVVVKLGVVQLLRKNFDICDELDKNKDDVELQCPIEKGDLTVSICVFCTKDMMKSLNFRVI